MLRRAEEGPQEIVTIASDSVGLEIPRNGVNLKDIQWFLKPLAYPMVSFILM